jgi:hypothetical protein
LDLTKDRKRFTLALSRMRSDCHSQVALRAVMVDPAELVARLVRTAEAVVVVVGVDVVLGVILVFNVELVAGMVFTVLVMGALEPVLVFKAAATTGFVTSALADAVVFGWPGDDVLGCALGL